MDDIFESILNSVKKLLGLTPEFTEFDVDVLMNINAAIFTLRQIGIGPKKQFTVTSADQTYADYLGEGCPEINQVKMYLYYKTKLGFDPPQSSLVAESMKEMIAEAEWRLQANVELKEFSVAWKEEETETPEEDKEDPETEEGGGKEDESL